MKRISLLFACVAFLSTACGPEADPGTPDPGATQESDTGGGGMMDDEDLDY